MKKLNLKTLRKWHLCFVSILLLGCGQIANARQSSLLAEGSPSPAFTLQVHKEGKGKAAARSLADYKGRWLLLDFWTRSCIACIKGFPKLQQISDSLSSKLDVILVGKNDQQYNQGIEKLYQRIAGQENLRLTTAFDTTVFAQFRVRSTPHVVLVSPNGQIKMAASGAALSLANLRELISEKPRQPLAQNVVIPSRSRLDTIGKVPYRSILAGRTGRDFGGVRNIIEGQPRGMFITHQTKLAKLYLLANFGWASWGMRDSCYGKWWPEPILQLRDTADFVSHFPTGKGLYRYQIQMEQKDAAPQLLMEGMKKDLRDWFGYASRIQMREMPVLELVCLSPTTAKKLASKAARQSIEGDFSKRSLRKVLVKEVIYAVGAYHPKYIIIDKTGITGEIDIELDANFASLGSIQKALKANGLDLTPGTKQLQVLVLSENQ